MERSARIGIAVAAAAVLAALAGAGVAGADGPTRTTVTVYHAFTPTGVIVPRVRVRSGQCFGSSGATPRKDAWRCMSGNDLYDPCFSSPHAVGVVVCPVPWQSVSIELRLTKPLPTKFPGSASPNPSLQPWAVETVSGADCFLNSGMGTTLDNKRDNYYCGNANSETFLWGNPDRTTEPWTIVEAPADAKTLVGAQRVGLKHVWI
jgi:hypothetical protein